MTALAGVTRPADGDTDDRDLVASVRAGDDRAFELLFQRYQPRIAAYVRGMVHDHGRAEDITQEVFMSALRRMRAETERELLFKPWIFEIAKNKCIDAFRRTRNTSEVSFDARDAIGAAEHGRLAEPGATPDSTVEGKFAIDNLCGAFGGLSPVHHDILVLRELEGLSYREIGERLGMSRPAVESTLFRARKRLSQEYEEIVSGDRCLRVQRIVDASGGRSAGLRDQRRMARHLAHCQSCRCYAGRAGLDLGVASRPAAAAAAARIAAFLPLPAFLRRRGSVGDEPAPLLGHGGSVGPWSANVATVLDPGLVLSWTKAIATAATVAVAGMGAGAALNDRAPAGAVTPGSKFGQAPGLVDGARGGAAAAPAEAPKRAPVRTQPARAGQPAAGGAQPAGHGPAARPAAAAHAPSHAVNGPRRPSDVGASDPPRPGGGAASGAGSGAPDPGQAVGHALGALRGDPVGAGSSAGSVASSNSTGLVQGGTAPVNGGVSALDAGPPTPVGGALKGPAAATAPVDSVPSTVSGPIASTTTAPDDLGG